MRIEWIERKRMEGGRVGCREEDKKEEIVLANPIVYACMGRRWPIKTRTVVNEDVECGTE
jgi:hypothetical protein